MSKTQRAIQQWDKWLEDFPGQCLLNAEKETMTQLVQRFLGQQALLIGTPQQHLLVSVTAITNRTLISPISSHKHQKNIRSIESGVHELPISSGSIDLVMLPHMLEFLDNPQRLLSEACRVVKPEGHIIVCGFNPISLFGLRRLLAFQHKSPWMGNFVKCSQVKKWLSLADFELIKQETILFRPLLQQENIFNKLQILEWLGDRLYPSLGAIYILVAKAKVIPLTPIKLSWKQKLSDVRLPAIGVPRPSTRNTR